MYIIMQRSLTTELQKYDQICTSKVWRMWLGMQPLSSIAENTKCLVLHVVVLCPWVHDLGDCLPCLFLFVCCWDMFVFICVWVKGTTPLSNRKRACFLFTKTNEESFDVSRPKHSLDLHMTTPWTTHKWRACRYSAALVVALFNSFSVSSSRSIVSFHWFCNRIT